MDKSDFGGLDSVSLIQFLQKLAGTQCFIKEQSFVSFKSSKEKKESMPPTVRSKLNTYPMGGSGACTYRWRINMRQILWQIHWNRDVGVSPPTLECYGFEELHLHGSTGFLLLDVPHPPSTQPHTLEYTLYKNMPSKRSLDIAIKIKGESDETCPLALPQGFSSLV